MIVYSILATLPYETEYSRFNDRVGVSFTAAIYSSEKRAQEEMAKRIANDKAKGTNWKYDINFHYLEMNEVAQ